jgi:hypothetical protein
MDLLSTTLDASAVVPHPGQNQSTKTSYPPTRSPVPSNKKTVVTVVAVKQSSDSLLGLGLTKKEGELGILVSYINTNGAFAGTELKVGMMVEAINGQQFKTCGHIGEYLKTVTGQVVIEASMPSKSKSSESPAPKRMRKPTLASETTRAILCASYESEYWRRYVPMAEAFIAREASDGNKENINPNTTPRKKLLLPVLCGVFT